MHPVDAAFVWNGSGILRGQFGRGPNLLLLPILHLQQMPAHIVCARSEDEIARNRGRRGEQMILMLRIHGMAEELLAGCRIHGHETAAAEEKDVSLPIDRRRDGRGATR